MKIAIAQYNDARCCCRAVIALAGMTLHGLPLSHFVQRRKVYSCDTHTRNISLVIMSNPNMPVLAAEDDTSGIIIPGPATIERFAERRRGAPKFVAGVNAPVNVSSYKGTDDHKHKPKAKRWDCT